MELIYYWLSGWAKGLQLKGRARRLELGAFVLGNKLATAVASSFLGFFSKYFLLLLLLRGTGPAPALKPLIIPVIQGIAALLAIIYIIPHLTLIVRRLHDIGYSAWLLPLGVIPPVLFVLWLNHTESDVASVFSKSLSFFAVYFVATGLFLLLKKGQPGANKWGENPKEVAVSA